MLFLFLFEEAGSLRVGCAGFRDEVDGLTGRTLNPKQKEFRSCWLGVEGLGGSGSV